MNDLLSAVLAAPDDDGPRLRYAAAARERGDSVLAELIEVQCAFAAAPRGSLAREELYRASYAVASVYGGVQGEKWGAANGFTGMWKARFERGFVHHVEIQAPHADDLTRLAALQPVQELALFPSLAGSSSTGEPAALLASPLIGRLRSLELKRFPKKGDVGAHLAAVPLPSLRTLTVSACKLDNAGARALASAALPALTDLSLFANTFGAPGMNALLHAFGERLTRLRISEHEVDAKLVRALASSPRLRSLQELVLDGAFLEETWVRELCDSPHLAHARLVLRSSEVARTAWPLWSARNPSCRLVAGDARIEGERVTITLAIENPSDRSLSAMKPHAVVRGRSNDHTLANVEMKIDDDVWNGIDVFSLDPAARRAITLELPRAELTRLEDHVAPGPWGIALTTQGANALFVQLAR